VTLPLHFRQTGRLDSEDVLVLVHAFPLHSAMWVPQLEEPPDDWRVIAPDLPGFGANPASGSQPMTMDAAADSVALLMDTLGVRRAVFGGLSMGGYVCLALLRRHPALLRGLLLCDTRATPDTEEVRRGRMQTAAKVMRAGTSEFVGGMLGRLLSPTTRQHQPAVTAEVKGMMLAAPAESVAAALRGMAERADATPLLSGLSVPTQIIVGSDDEVTPPAEARTLARAIPAASLVVIDDAGHLPNLERPAEFNRALASFLASLR
jgi:3-oxoadipate enol-lactonase